MNHRRLSQISLIAIALFALVPDAHARDGFLFSTFRGEQTPMTEQIYFAVSDDGRQWSALNNGKPALISNLGEKGVRDPYLFRAHEGGKFFLIATDLSINLTPGWPRATHNGSHSIVIWESSDLVHWSPPRLAKIAPQDAGCTWAPEAIWDEEAGDYLVYWSGMNARDNFAKQRIWAAHTKDFVTFGEPFIFVDNAKSTIDADIVRDGDKYIRFSKDETVMGVIEETADHLAGPWTQVKTYTLANLIKGYEGPACFELKPATAHDPATWCLLLDHYTKSAGYEPFVTQDLAAGKFERAADITFPFHFRHGSVLPITNEELTHIKATDANATTRP